MLVVHVRGFTRLAAAQVLHARAASQRHGLHLQACIALGVNGAKHRLFHTVPHHHIAVATHQGYAGCS